MKPHDDDSGDWQGLDSEDQTPRYRAISEVLRKFNADGAVLDVGCGEALLRGWLPKDSNYTGLEPSGKAVQLALKRDASAKVVHTLAEDFDAPPGSFDCVVFNEMLYYAADPISLLPKYAATLRKGGMILCSIYQRPGQIPLKRRLKHWLNSRLPMSNVHCTEMVRAFMKRSSWPILEERTVPIPGAASEWRVWLARPE